METEKLDIIENKELIINREEKIQSLIKLILQSADGVNIVGDGENLVHETDDLLITHEFVDGIYIRRMDINQGSFVVGAIHKHLHVWFLMFGHITVATSEDTIDYEAPCYVIANPGVQRLIYAQDDSIFINVHKNLKNTKDIDILEKQIYSLNREDYNKHTENK